MQCGTLTLFHSRFHPELFPAWLLRDWLTTAVSNEEGDDASKVVSLAAGTGDIADNADSTFEIYLAWMYPAAWLLVLLVPCTIGIFFVAAMLLLDRMFAVAMAYVFGLAMMLTWTMMRWKFEAWRCTFKVKLLLAFTAAMAVAFEI